LRVVKDKKPKIFLGENVKGILSMANGKVFQMIQNDFRKIGYTVEYKVFDASEFGVPQKRERVIIYGTRINKSLILSPVPEKGKTVEESIGFLANVPLSQNSFSVNGRIIHNHIASTNVETEFRGRKYKINQHELCDYLNE
jgi:DNA (cytosine-5)-methyltransferase 1